MTELVFLACLSGAPDVCDEKALQFADVSVMACMMSAQPQLALWARDHPGWEIRRWTCRPVRWGLSI